MTPIPTTLRPTGVEPIAASADTLTVIAWHDQVIEQTPGAIRTDSDDALVWWTCSVGSIAVVMAHRFARHAADGSTVWTLDDIAATFGISGSRSDVRVRRSLDRLVQFGIAHRSGHTLAVRLWLPPLTRRQRDRLPGYLGAAYDDAVGG
ncbi:MAG TPA: hypothetical protein VNQ73_02650 [Ilumatobacter sp.]|nr:hypothetical protein [Ilumatobacter sp.]